MKYKHVRSYRAGNGGGKEYPRASALHDRGSRCEPTPHERQAVGGGGMGVVIGAKAVSALQALEPPSPCVGKMLLN